MVKAQIRPLAALPHQGLGRGIGAGFTQIFICFPRDCAGPRTFGAWPKGIGAVVGRFFRAMIGQDSGDCVQSAYSRIKIF